MTDLQSTNNKPANKFHWGKFILYYFLIIAVIGGFVAGFYYGKVESEKIVDAKARIQESEFISGEITGKNTVPKFLTRDIDFDIYWDVWNRVMKSYVDKPVSQTKMLYGSLSGMVAAAGDPYTMFFDPEIAFKFQQELEGNFEGIGAEIGIKNDRLTVIAPLPDTPAEKAGLRPSDKIYFIGDVDTSNISTDEAVSLIRGPKGTTVVLKIWRDNNGEDLINIPIVRDKINVISVTWEKIKNEETGNNIAYIKIRHFDEKVDAVLDEVASEVLSSRPDGIILDLRSNPGGYLDRSINVASKWIAKGDAVVKEKDSEGDIIEYDSSGRSSFAGIKTVVLINGGSASASEIVAGALQDYGLATLVGKTSFGKGSVQDYQNLEDGSALKITVARWLTPKDRFIDKEGITPDIEVELSDEDYNTNRDPQLDRAVEFLVKGE
ncbi:MAG: S41 family peptidase [bacterium]